MQPPFRIRPAQPQDIPALLRMKRALTELDGASATLLATENDWLRDGFGPEPRFKAFIAEREAAAVGMITYSELYLTALAGAVLFIQDLFVEPACRKLGIGRALLARLAEEAVQRRIPLIQLTVLEGNPARKFYRRLGFQHLRECLTYAVAGQPMLDLALSLSDKLAV